MRSGLSGVYVRRALGSSHLVCRWASASNRCTEGVRVWGVHLLGGQLEAWGLCCSRQEDYSEVVIGLEQGLQVCQATMCFGHEAGSCTTRANKPNQK